MGFFLEIESDCAAPSARIFSGARALADPPLCQCPGCGESMFPVFSMHRSILVGNVLPGVDARGYVTLDVCASCGHFLENYFTSVIDGVRIARGGDIADDGPFNHLDTPFVSRAVRLMPECDEQWESPEFIAAYDEKKLLSGVLHQLGGKKMKRERVPIDNCLCCGGSVRFFGMIDSDDLNISLYEGSEPLSLMIADMKSLNVLVCTKCAALNYGITVD